jgi:hypothetical protein
MTAKLSIDCSCGGNLIILSDPRSTERKGFYACVEVFFHEGESKCEENLICEKLYLANQHHHYFDAIQTHIINKQKKTKKEKVKK